MYMILSSVFIVLRPRTRCEFCPNFPWTLRTVPTRRFWLAVMTHVGRDTHTVRTIYPKIMISLCSCKSLIKTGCSLATTVSENHNKHKNANMLLLIFFSFKLTIKHPRTSAILLHIILRRSSLVVHNIIHTDMVY